MTTSRYCPDVKERNATIALPFRICALDRRHGQRARVHWIGSHLKHDGFYSALAVNPLRFRCPCAEKSSVNYRRYIEISLVRLCHEPLVTCVIISYSSQ